MKKLIAAMSLLITGCAPVVYTYDDVGVVETTGQVGARTTVTEYYEGAVVQAPVRERVVVVRPAPFAPYTTTNRWDPYYGGMRTVVRPYYRDYYAPNPWGSFLFGAGVGYLLAR